MTTTISTHIRSNVVGYAAVFLAMTGTAVALPGRATVQSNDVKPNAIKSKHIGDGQVAGVDIAAAAVGASEVADESLSSSDVADASLTGADVAPNSLSGASISELGLDSNVIQRRVTGNCQPGEAMAAIGPNGAVGCNPVGGGVPTGPAGGDLSGDYPNPQIAAGAVGTPEIANGAVNGAKVLDGSLLGSDIADSSLTGLDVNERLLDLPKPLGQLRQSCDPSSATFVTCATRSVEFTGEETGAALVIASVHWDTDAGGGNGFCRLDVGTQTGSQIGIGENSNTTSQPGFLHETTMMSVVGGGRGDQVDLALRCNEAQSDIAFVRADLVVIGPIAVPS